MLKKNLKTTLQFNKKLKFIINHHHNRRISFGELTGLLAENDIKFFNKDELSKINKIFPTTFHTLCLREIFTYFELACVQALLNAKIFIIKVRGRILDPKLHSPKKRAQAHHIFHCIKVLTKLLLRFYGKEVFWFRALGGVMGTNIIKLKVFEGNIHKLLKNSSHSACISRILQYLTTGISQETNDIQWQGIRMRLHPELILPDDVFREVNRSEGKIDRKTDISRSVGFKDADSLRITSLNYFSSIPINMEWSKPNQRMQTLTGVRNTAMEKMDRKRLKSQGMSPERRISMQMQERYRFSEEKEPIIHSNSIMHRKIFQSRDRPKIKAKSSCSKYQVQ